MNSPADNPMDKLSEINSKVDNIISLTKLIFPIDQKLNLPRSMHEVVSGLNTHVEQFNNIGVIDKIEDFEKSLRIFDAIGIYASAIGRQGLALPDNPNISMFGELLMAGNSLREFIGKLEVGFSGIITVENAPMLPDMAIKKNWEELNKQFSEHTNKIQAKLEVADSEINRHELRVQAFSDLLDNNLQKYDLVILEAAQKVNLFISTTEKKIEKNGILLADQYDTTIKQLKGREMTVAKLLGGFASSVLAGGYAKSAENEQKSADNFRKISVGLMAVIVVVLAFTLYQISRFEIDWKEATLRLIISLFLSVPVGYLARESSRHRGQYYNYLQTSLDFSAIGPFIESLSPEAREKIKSVMAERTFFQRGGEGKIIDNYGIDFQAIFIKLLDKLEITKLKN